MTATSSEQKKKEKNDMTVHECNSWCLGQLDEAKILCTNEDWE